MSARQDNMDARSERRGGRTGGTGGTGQSRLGIARTAHRRPARARLSLSGPSGSGKTWTALSIGFELGKRVVVIDTEYESAELYADNFPPFTHIPWEPPFSPADLAATIREAGQKFDVVIIDSATHFWSGEGGTLETADSKFSGWKVATPQQNAMVESMLRSPAHIIMCTRAKQEYLVEEGDGGRQKVKKLGLAPVQRNDLEYEMNVCLMLDMNHTIDVVKTRATVFSGRSFPPNKQTDFAQLYAEWLLGGEALAPQAQIDEMRDRIRAIPDQAAGKRIGAAITAKFGRGDQMTESQMPEVRAYLDELIAEAEREAAQRQAAEPEVPPAAEPAPSPVVEEPAPELPAPEPETPIVAVEQPTLADEMVHESIDQYVGTIIPNEEPARDDGPPDEDPVVTPPPLRAVPTPPAAPPAAPATSRQKGTPLSAAKAALENTPARRIEAVLRAIEATSAKLAEDQERELIQELKAAGLFPPRDLKADEAIRFDEVIERYAVK